MRLSLSDTLGNRDTSTSRDSRIVNGFAEDDKDIGVGRSIKRPGLTNRYSLPLGQSSATIGQALFGFTFVGEGSRTQSLVGIRGDKLTYPVS